MRTLFAFLILVFVVAAVAAAVTFSQLPDVGLLKTHYPVVHVLPPAKNAHGRETQRFDVRLSQGRPGAWVDLGEVSRSALAAIIMSEDGNFYTHDGYDMDEIKRAFKQDVRSGRFKRGASTITQQVAKNVYLSNEKSVWRKLLELAIALRLEEALSKGRILEVYVNIAEWGPGIFGIGAASRYYFGKDPGSLNTKEGAFLAMLLPSPIRYSQSYRDGRLTRYAAVTIRRLMEKLIIVGRLTPQEFEEEWKSPMAFEKAPPATADEPGADDEFDERMEDLDATDAQIPPLEDPMPVAAEAPAPPPPQPSEPARPVSTHRDSARH
ncbi:MAG TPA: monofunctional biosynthetic peptidoglycan transglycosylase [Bdellovibrionota bacterium]|jgi:monofunctional biosynthetic peptidoglycan transglycosylase|nr:monofunctional biosynthetic peptidoglycan transglycosylase [Bdellovibrionota bacterium]